MSLGHWADVAVKTYFEEVEPLHTLVEFAAPLLELIPKSGIEGGDTGLFFTLAGSRSFAGALADAQEVANLAGDGGPGTAPAASTYNGEWRVPEGRIETSLRLRHIDLVRAKTNRGAYVRHLVHETKNHVMEFGERIAQVILGPEGYPVATNVSGVTSTGVIAFDDPEEVSNFIIGMPLVASDDDGSSAAHTLLPSNVGRAVAYVKSVNRETGSITLSAVSASGAAGLPAGWGTDPTGIYLFPLGQFRPLLQGSTIGSKLLIQPLALWLTPTAASDQLYGVDRSVDTALSGVRIPSSSAPPLGTLGLPIEQKLQFAEVFMQSRFACRRAHTWVLHPTRWFEMARSLEAQGLLERGDTLKSGAKTLNLMGVNGDMKIVSDPHQSPDFAYGLLPEEIQIRHLDGFPAVMNADGLEFLRQADSNDLEMRLVSYPKLIVREPWRHCRVNLTT